MASDRIRLSDRARKRLFALANAADIDPSFLLEFLIFRHGTEAAEALTGKQGSLMRINDPKQVLTAPVVSLTSTNDANHVDTSQLVTQTDPYTDTSAIIPGNSTARQQNLAKWLASDDEEMGWNNH